MRPQSFLRAVAKEGGRILQALSCEIKIFDPASLPLPDEVPDSHPKLQKLRELALWSAGMVWSSPERHGAMTGILKAQIDWIPLSAIGVSTDTRKNSSFDASFWRITLVQCSQSNANSGPLDADDYDP